MKHIYILFFLLIFSLLGCVNMQKRKTIYSDFQSIFLGVDTIKIPLDSISLPIYYSATDFYFNDASSFVFAFNTKTWSIDIFNLKSKEISHVALSREDENAINDVRCLQVLSIDSIVCFNDNWLHIINNESEILAKIDLEYVANDFAGGFELGQFMRPFYDASKNIVYGRFISSKSPYPYPNGQELFASLNVETGEWTLLPIYLSEYMARNWRKMGQNRHINAWIEPDRISYNFTCLSDVFVYNIKKGVLQSAGGESRLVNNEVAFYSGDTNNENAKWEHWINNPVFYYPVFDKYKNIYYRIQTSELKDGFHGKPTPYDKKNILSIFSHKLEMIYEVQLPNYVFNFNIFGVTPQGLYIDGNNPNDQSLDYEFFKIYRIRIHGMNQNEK